MVLLLPRLAFTVKPFCISDMLPEPFVSADDILLSFAAWQMTSYAWVAQFRLHLTKCYFGLSPRLKRDNAEHTKKNNRRNFFEVLMKRTFSWAIIILLTEKIWINGIMALIGPQIKVTVLIFQPVPPPSSCRVIFRVVHNAPRSYRSLPFRQNGRNKAKGLFDCHRWLGYFRRNWRFV